MSSAARQQKLRKLAAVVDSCRQRQTEYGSILRKANAEETAAAARVRVLTPLPRVSHDQETNERLKSLRCKYEGVVKSAKTIAAVAQRKQRVHMAAEEKAQKVARKLIASASSTSTSTSKKSKKSKKTKKTKKTKK